MNITDIKIRRLYSEGKLKAMVSMTIDGEFAVHDIKVIEGPQRLFVAMPSRKEDNGSFRDIVHPISQAARQNLEELILEEYERKLAEMQADEELKSESDVEKSEDDLPLDAADDAEEK